MSEKNRLQEYCQKHKLSLPMYKSWSEGEPHKLQWSASVVVMHHMKKITANTLVPCNSKVAAEKQAAIMLLDCLRSRNKSHTVSQIGKLKIATEHAILSSHKAMFNVKMPEVIETEDSTSEMEIQENCNPEWLTTIYFIDLENSPAFKIIADPNALYIGFINSIHHSMIKYKHWHICSSDSIESEITESGKNKLLYQIDGGTNDLVDHFMSTCLYPLVDFLIKYSNCQNVYIVTNDHAGWCTRSCLERILIWKKIINVKIINASKID